MFVEKITRKSKNKPFPVPMKTMNEYPICTILRLIDGF